MGASNAHDQVEAPLKVLILGGTHEARMLADALASRGVDVTTALAGRTRAPAALPGAVRIGGFGGADGLARYLEETGVTRLVDATHPFAAVISANAANAARASGVPLVRLARPPWPEPEGAHWHHCDSVREAAADLPPGARVLLTIGRQEVSPFSARTDCRFVARVIDPPEPVPDGWRLVLARGPYTETGERALLRETGTTHLVTKNAGGEATAAKLVAARELGVSVLMVDRPVLPPAPTVTRVAEALAWLDIV